MTGRQFYPWQERALEELRGKSGVLAAPTGSGKTWVAYLWAGLLDGAGNPTLPPERIIFTAPIKALSNERYLDLRRMGFEVGLETGDFKKNAGAPVLCCTQEIYTLKYAGKPGLRLIVDEFHYIFSDSQRARAYIDGLRRTHDDVPVLVMSATFGRPRSVATYLERIANRPFALSQHAERATELVYQKEPVRHPREIHDALVFLFSRDGVRDLAEAIAEHRRPMPTERLQRLEEIARILGVARPALTLLKGVGTYHGSMLPKEKLLVETAFRERLLDTVVGTDALALGVNLPAERVIFAQLSHYHSDESISKNEFLQMAGRAGRKGLYEVGYVTWVEHSPYENRKYEIGDLYAHLLRQHPEPAEITLHPAFGRLLREEVAPEAEAEFVAACSMPEREYEWVVREIRASLRKINLWSKRFVPQHQRQQFRRALADIWFEEMEVGQNLQMAWLFIEDERPDALGAADILERVERNRLQALLKVKRFVNALPEGYNFRNMDELDEEIERIDPTVFTFEERLERIDDSRGEEPFASISTQLIREERRRSGPPEERRRKKHSGGKPRGGKPRH